MSLIHKVIIATKNARIIAKFARYCSVLQMAYSAKFLKQFVRKSRTINNDNNSIKLILSGLLTRVI